MDSNHDIHLDIINAVKGFIDKKEEGDAIICFHSNSKTGFFAGHIIGDYQGLSDIITCDISLHKKEVAKDFESYQNLAAAWAIMSAEHNAKVRELMLDYLVAMEIEYGNDIRNN